MAKVQRGGPRASRNGKKPRAHLWLKLCASVVERPRLQRDVRDHVPPKKHQHSRRITYCGEPFARLCPASLAAAPDVGRKAPVARCIATRGIAKLDAARLPIDLDWTLRLCCAASRARGLLDAAHARCFTMCFALACAHAHCVSKRNQRCAGQQVARRAAPRTAPLCGTERQSARARVLSTTCRSLLHTRRSYAFFGGG